MNALGVATLICCVPLAWSAPGGTPRQAAWTRLASPHFELLTTTDEDAGRRLILRLEWLRTALQPILSWQSEGHGEVRAGRETPICIIEFASHDEFQQYASTGRSIGYFLPGMRRDFVVLDGTHAEGRSAAHEYVHAAIWHSGLRLPAWLDEGLAELYSNLEEGRPRGRSEIGRLIPSRVNSLRQSGWIELAGLTAATADSGMFTATASVDDAYAESWLLAHMLVLDPRYRDKFPALLTALQTFNTGEAFLRVYGKSMAQMETDFRGYLDISQMNARPLGDPPGVALQQLTAQRGAEVEGVTALAEMLSGYRGRTEQSRDLYRQLEQGSQRER